MPRRTYRRSTKKTATHEGFRSGFEKRVAECLGGLGLLFEYETERFAYHVEHSYKPDFVLVKKDGSKLYLETKGYFQGSDRTKTIAVLREHPGLDLRFLFVRASNRITPGSKTTYSAWCEKHGIPWAEGETLPKAWLKELR